MPPFSQSPRSSGFQATKKACALGTRVGEWQEDPDVPFHGRILLNPDLNRLLAEMWTSMASGPAIDDQADARWGSSATLPKPISSGSALPPGPDDVDFVPHDLAPAGSVAASGLPSRPCQMVDWDDLDDDEEEFYGR